MIDVIRQQFKEDMDQRERVHITREFLQIICLKIMNEKRMFDDIAFLGGTALRILYDLRRFSEDLDFSTTSQNLLDIESINTSFISGFEKYGLKISTQRKNVGAICSIIFKFEGLLKELGLSALDSQKILIKWDVDQNPPDGAITTNTIINKQFMFNITHYDLPSLFSGKLHACLFRKYVKGRDWYDFLWYISSRKYPNFDLLNNSIKQTEEKDLGIDQNNFKKFLLKRVNEINFDAAKKDVERFLEDKSELEALNTKYITETIEKTY